MSETSAPTPQTASPAAPPPYWGDINRILEWLPHRYPFVFVDRILSLDLVARKIVGTKQVTHTEPHFQGHFPGQPVMPGVLMIEGMAQTGAVLLYQLIPDREKKLVLFAGIDNTRFRRQVVPGDTVTYEVEITRLRSMSSRMTGRALVGGDVAVEAEFMSFIVDRAPDV